MDDDQYGLFSNGYNETIQEHFEAFKDEKPEIERYIVAVCFDLKRKGYDHYGIGAVWERMRWHFQIEKGMAEEFKLNNNYRSRYARLVMAKYPELDGFFEVRELKSE